jgi:putative FmdB family regulatory protein
MPIYEYQCLSCGRRTETLQRMADPPLTVCENCGGELKKLISSPAFQFKGSGWYVTDYAGKKGGSSSSESKDSKESKESKSSGGSSESGASSSASSESSASKPAESKPSGSGGSGSSE